MRSPTRTRRSVSNSLPFGISCVMNCTSSAGVPAVTSDSVAVRSTRSTYDAPLGAFGMSPPPERCAEMERFVTPACTTRGCAGA